MRRFPVKRYQWIAIAFLVLAVLRLLFGNGWFS
jgi:hypothetical protein